MRYSKERVMVLDNLATTFELFLSVVAKILLNAPNSTFWGSSMISGNLSNCLEKPTDHSGPIKLRLDVFSRA